MSDTKAKKPRKPTAAEVRPQGRPSTFTQEVADSICERIADGEPLRQICRDESMPAWRTVYDWMKAHTDFATRIAGAREAGFDAIAHECLEIADETAFDTLIGESGDRANSEWISRSKLRVETRLKLLAKWDPKRYGDKVDVNHGGQDGNPVNMNWSIDFVKPRDES
jgi:transposase